MICEAAMREAIAHGDAAWEELIVVAHHRLSKIARYVRADPPTPNPDYDRLHRAFHSALLGGCNSSRMISIADELFDHSERYRNLSRTLVVAPREEEHSAMLRAALNRNADEAVRLIKAHVELTYRIVAKHAELLCDDARDA